MQSDVENGVKGGRFGTLCPEMSVVQGLPQRVVLGEAVLKRICREGSVNVGLAAAAVARVPADGLAEEFLDIRHEGVEGWQGEAREGEVGGREAARERGGVVALRRGDLLLGNLLLPERVDGERLLHAERRQARVRPGRRRVAVLFRPKAVPPGRAVVRLRRVVVPFAVAGPCTAPCTRCWAARRR